MTAERERLKASQGARNYKFFVVALPENARKRDHVATMPTKALRLVDLLTIKTTGSGHCSSPRVNHAELRSFGIRYCTQQNEFANGFDRNRLSPGSES